MIFLSIAIVILYAILLVAGGFLVFEILKSLLDKKSLERELSFLQKQFSEFQKDANRRLSGYKDSYDELYKKFESYQSSCKSIISENNLTIDRIVDYANKITDLNSQFFDKIKLISNLLEQENPPKDEIAKLSREISRDIEEQKKLREQQEKQHRQRMDKIERRRQQNGKEIGEDFEK